MKTLGLLVILCSRADSERIHSDSRSNLYQLTFVSLMSMKFNCNACSVMSNLL